MRLPTSLLMLVVAITAPAAELATDAVVAIPALADSSEVPDAALGGAGFIIAADAQTLTGLTLAEAVPSDADAFTVVLPGGRRLQARVERRGERSTALLFTVQRDGTTAPRPLELADSEQLRIGDHVWTAGNPFGALETDGRAALSRGIVSGRYAIPPSEPPMRGRLGRVLSHYRGPVIETDAAINDGNQGGPLLDAAGRVVGIVSLGVVRQRRVGTVVPIARVAAELELGPVPHAPQVTADPLTDALVDAAGSIAAGIALVYLERPRGPGNPDGPPRPRPLSAAIPPYMREALEQAWGIYYHAQQVFYTDQAVPALCIDPQAGLLLTAASNLHGDARHGRVLTPAAETPYVSCSVLAVHKVLDLALLQAEGSLPFAVVELAAAPDLHAGDPVAVVGRHRDGGGFTMTAGVVSATERRRTQSRYHLHQTDALVNYGSLGGAVIDCTGAVVGVTCHLGPRRPWGINSGVAMFVDTGTIADVLPTLRDGTDVLELPIVGLGIRVESRKGPPRVSLVNPDLGAAAAGMEVDDLILAINDKPVREHADISRLLVGRSAGAVVRVRVERDGEPRELEVELQVFDAR
ncbi:MAG: S1C family serine protease [Planctomycetota bacterium]